MGFVASVDLRGSSYFSIVGKLSFGAFSTATVLCTQHHYFQNVFITPKGSFMPIKDVFPSPSPWQLLLCFLPL